MNIVDIAKELETKYNLQGDFSLENNELIPADAYTASYITHLINGMGYDVINKGGHLLLTGKVAQTESPLAQVSESNNPIVVAMKSIDRLKNASSKQEAEAIWNDIMSQGDVFNRQNKSIEWIKSNPEAMTTIKIIDNTLGTDFVKQIGNSNLAEGENLGVNFVKLNSCLALMSKASHLMLDEAKFAKDEQKAYLIKVTEELTAVYDKLYMFIKENS